MPGKKKAAARKAVKLVKMERNGKTADVHPDEVENWKKADWKEVK